MREILGYQPWPTNGHLIADVAALGYITDTDLVLDATYGRGVWWRRFRPHHLVTNGLDPLGTPMMRFDFTRPPFRPASFDVVLFDPPFKLNGTPEWKTDVDVRYGVGKPETVADRMQLIYDGLDALTPLVKPGGFFLVKCQAQVVSGHVVWQDRLIADRVEAHPFRLVDRFDRLGHRAQPKGRTQKHAKRNASTLLVFERFRTKHRTTRR